MGTAEEDSTGGLDWVDGKPSVEQPDGNIDMADIQKQAAIIDINFFLNKSDSIMPI